MQLTIIGDTLFLSGQVDVRCTARLREALYGLLDEAPQGLVIDLAEVEAIDLTTVKLLAVASRAAERDGRRIVLRHCSPAARRMLHLSHLRWLIQVEPDRVAV